jgi:hypothetical protein
LVGTGDKLKLITVDNKNNFEEILKIVGDLTKKIVK